MTDLVIRLHLRSVRDDLLGALVLNFSVVMLSR